MKNCLAVLALVAALLLPWVAWGAPDPRSERHRARAEQYVRDGDLKAAAIELRNVIQLNPRDAAAHKALGKLYLDLRDAAASFRHYQEAVSLATDDVEARLAVATYYVLAGRFEDAEAHAREAVRLEPDAYVCRAVLARALAGARKWGEAVQAYHEAIELGPGIEALRIELAGVHERARDLAAAERVLREGLAAIPPARHLRLALADLLVDRGQTAEADALAAEVENLAAGSPELLRAAALYHLRRESAKAAESALRKAIGATVQGSPERLALLGDLAALYLMRGDAEEAKEVLGEIRRVQPGDPAAARHLAALHLIEGNLPAAQDLISETLSRDPNDREARVLRARIDLAQGRYGIAAETLRRVVEEEPKSVDGNFYLAKALAAQAQWQEARTLFLLVLDRVPEHFGASLDLARTYLGMGRPLDALESVDRALKLRAGDPEARGVKARALLEAGRGPEAEAEYRALAAANDDGATALIGLGRALELQGRRDEALQTYREAGRRAPGLVDAVIWEMDLLDRMGRHDGVERVGLAFLERSGEAPPVLNALAVHALGRRQPDRAKGYLERSLAAAPDAVPTLEIQARVLLAEGDAEGARQVLEKALRTHPDRVSALLLQIIALERLGRAKEVRAAYKQILGADPDNALAANNLASLYLRDGTELAEALRLAQVAVDRSPGSGAAKDTLGWAYYKTGHYEQAARVLEEAHRLLPDNPEVVYHLGMASAKLGQDEKAQELLVRALAAEKKGDWAFEAGQVLQELQAKKP